jgi:murein L,D-transpeptidase YcbB/YkuD
MPAAMRLYIATVFSLLLAVSSVQAGNNQSVGENIRQLVTSGHLNLGKNLQEQRLFQIFTFYEDRDFKPVWTRDAGVKGKGKALLRALQNAHEHGLDPKFYGVNDIANLINTTNPEELAELDIVMSLEFASFATDLSKGRLDPVKVNKGIYIKTFSPGAVTLIDGAEAAADLEPYLDKLASKSPRYHRLKKALADYRAMAAHGPWPTIAKGKALKPGMEDPRVPTLKTLLATMGDLKSNENPDTITYDDTLVGAVKAFQSRHGLTDDGVVGPGTRKALNVPLATRINQMVINLERRRWMPDNFGKRYVFINLADQILKVVDTLPTREKTVHVARVVVGKLYHNTPIFSDKMAYLVVNPYWNVPASIANKEYLPKLRRDPGYLKRQNIRIIGASGEINPYSVNWNAVSRIPYRLRQDTGARNALGRIKFIFPNKFNVYIHDTPSKSLFARDTRYFSHGCMRVQYPVKLAETLLKPQGWSAQGIKQQIASGKRRIIKLKSKIPVHVTYLTSWVNKDGSVNFRKDVYRRDQNLIKALVPKTK